MNKKLASLLFAIAAGASATTAIAQVREPSCIWSFKLVYDDCKRSGTDPMQCDMDRIDCSDRCGI